MIRAIFAVLLVMVARTIQKISRNPKRQEEEELKFWQWFQANEKELHAAMPGQDAIFDELFGKLFDVCTELTYEVSQIEQGKREFVVSAGGVQSVFPNVISLVDRAPALQYWNIVKFRQSRGFTELQFDDVTVTAKDVYFTLALVDGKYEIVLYIRNYRPNKTYLSIAYLILDMSLGEYAVETQVKKMLFQPLTDEIEHTHRSLDKLSAALDILS